MSGKSLLLWLTSLTPLVLAACPGPQPIPSNNTPRPQGSCDLQIESTQKTTADLSAKLDYALVEVAGKASYDSFQEVKVGFDQLQRDFDLQSYKLCQDAEAGRVSQAYYEKRRTCMDNALSAMRVMESDLVNLKERDPQEAAWAIESKLAWIQGAVQCDNEQAPGLTIPSGAPKVELTAYLLCQRKAGSGWEDVPNCDGAELREGDRVRFGYKTAAPARIYILAHNSTGQFQMLFPDPGIDNESTPNADTFVPGDDWFVLDDVGGVTEVVQIVASAEKLPELEALRGKDFPPQSAPVAGGGNGNANKGPQVKTKPKAAPEAYKTRGLLEPIIMRGFKAQSKGKAPVRSSVGQAEVATVPAVNTLPGASAVEFRVIHK